MKQSGPLYQPGDIYSFRTAPFTEFSARETNRFATLKVLGVGNEGLYCVVVLDGIFASHPDIRQVEKLGWLHDSRFALVRKSAFEKGGPECFFVVDPGRNDLDEFRLVGRVKLSRPDLELIRSCRSYALWSMASFDAEGEWRWKNDRSAYEREVALKGEADQARFRAEQTRIENRLKKLTWEKLLEEQPFARWGEIPGQPPYDFIVAARARVRSDIEALRQLGPKPKRRDVRAILKACAEWFNQSALIFGDAIETQEREDILTVLEEMAYVARQRPLVAEIDAWRSW